MGMHTCLLRRQAKFWSRSRVVLSMKLSKQVQHVDETRRSEEIGLRWCWKQDSFRSDPATSALTSAGDYLHGGSLRTETAVSTRYGLISNRLVHPQCGWRMAACMCTQLRAYTVTYHMRIVTSYRYRYLPHAYNLHQSNIQLHIR